MAKFARLDKNRPGGVGFYATDVDQSQERMARQTYQPGQKMSAAASAPQTDRRKESTNPKTPWAQVQQQNQAAGGGGGGSSPYIEQLNALYDQIVNRKPFQYDLNGDLLYRQMADRYTLLGQQAMRDATGTAAALTGGYGNSYANQVGNQALQQYLTALNEQIPALYDRALNTWQAQGDDLLMKYQLAAAHPGNIQALTPRSGGGSTQETPAESTTTYNSLLSSFLNGGLTGAGLGVMGGTPAAQTQAAAQQAAPMINAVDTQGNPVTVPYIPGNPLTMGAYYEQLKNLYK